MPPREELLESGGAVGTLVVAALIGWASVFHPAAAAHAQAGTPVADTELAALDGGKARLLADAAVNVLVFVRPEQERSLKALKQLGECQKGVAGKPVRWVAIVSSAAPKASVTAMVRESALAMPVLVDEGDALYGNLGVALHPVAVIVGPERRLAAFEPFRSIHYCAVVTARVRHALREISDDELQRALAPPTAARGGDAQVALRYRALAETLFKAGNHAKALENARRSLERDPALASAHALLGDILAAQGDCGAAREAYRKAREIDPSALTYRKDPGPC